MNEPRMEDLEPRSEDLEPADPENALYEQHRREHGQWLKEEAAKQQRS